MKTIVIHGTNAEKINSRMASFIKEAKKRGWEIVRIDGKKIDNLTDLFSSQSLFGTDQFYLLENLTALNKKQNEELKNIIENTQGTLIVKHNTVLSATSLKHLGKIDKEEKYELEETLWQFLDSFYPGNLKRCLSLFHKTLIKNPPELLVSLLARQLREMFIVQIDPKSAKIPEWRVSRLKKQAEPFGENGLKSAISGLSELDVKYKTTTLDITQALDLYLVQQLYPKHSDL